LGAVAVPHAPNHLLTGEADMPCFLRHVNPIDHAYERLDTLIVHLVALQAVQDLLGHQHRRVHRRAGRCRHEKLATAVQDRGRSVSRRADTTDRLGEHGGVTTLVLDLGERVVHVAACRVLVVDVLEQHPHQQHFEPHAG
jgi:hypothetical protein